MIFYYSSIIPDFRRLSRYFIKKIPSMLGKGIKHNSQMLYQKNEASKASSYHRLMFSRPSLYTTNALTDQYGKYSMDFGGCQEESDFKSAKGLSFISTRSVSYSTFFSH